MSHPVNGPVQAGTSVRGLRGFLQNPRPDALSGFFIFLIALPLSVGISLASGAPPLAGVHAASERLVSHPRVQKTGLALVGHGYGVVPTRVQILGETELSFLATLPEEKKHEAMRFFYGLGLSCVVVTGNNRPHVAIIEEADKLGVPVYLSEARSSRTINAIHALLDERLAPRASLHGVLVDIFTVGVLILGKSGIGKSECALDLVTRGHRLVADDIVNIKRKPAGPIYGSGSNIIGHHMEIRGLGIINIKDLFGISAVRERKKLELVVELMDWDERVEYDRLGIEEQKYRILDVEVPLMTIPVRPGRNLTTIIEVAARNHHQHPEQGQRHAQALQRGSPLLQQPAAAQGDGHRRSGIDQADVDRRRGHRALVDESPAHPHAQRAQDDHAARFGPPRAGQRGDVTPDPGQEQQAHQCPATQRQDVRADHAGRGAGNDVVGGPQGGKDPHQEAGQALGPEVGSRGSQAVDYRPHRRATLARPTRRRPVFRTRPP